LYRVGELTTEGRLTRQSKQRSAHAGCSLEADFATLEDAMTALQAEDFQDIKANTETLGSTIFLFEVQEV
jgi:hypothetical protein